MLNTAECIIAHASTDLQQVVNKFKLKASAYFVDKLTIGMISHLTVNGRSLGSSCSFRQLSDGGMELLFLDKADNRRAIRVIGLAKLGLCPELKSGSVYVPLPVITSERRSSVIRSLFLVLEQFKLNARAIRRRAITQLKLVKPIGYDIKRVCLKRIEDNVFEALSELQRIYEANEHRLSLS
ncbi:MAG: ribosome recycling factor [Candidatus Hodgkinia cicadicola]